MDQFEEIASTRIDNVTIVRELDLTEELTRGKSLVISLGGDGCFLRTCSQVTNSEIPMLGINTDPARSLGILTGKFLYSQKSIEK